MAGRVRHHHGGIRGLADVLRDHGEAIRFELISRGIQLDTLGDPAFTWVDLRAFIRFLPPGNALARERIGEAAQWTPDTYLLALIADALHTANWQRGGDKHAKRPTRIERPRLPGAAPAAAEQGTTVKGRGASMSMDDMAARLGWGGDGRNATR